MSSIALAFACLAGIVTIVYGGEQPKCCPVVELRQYTLKPGQREVLIDLFDKHFVESQEATGMTIIGQFRDRHRPDRFVWMRGFEDMAVRHRALEQFYGGPVWAEHRTAANATMVDVSDVLLLRPARPDTAFQFDESDASAARQPTAVIAAIYALTKPADDALVARFERDVVPRLKSRAVSVKGVFVTEPAPNTFARLPVREGEPVLVWVGTVAATGISDTQLDALRKSSAVDGIAAPTLLSLDPTSRSRLGDGPHAARK